MDPRDAYCIDVCKAKCCTHPVHKVECPRLGPDKRCTIYELRYRPGAPAIETVGFYEHGGKTFAFKCGRIGQLIADGHVPDDVVAGCCYAHPELLVRIGNHGSETGR